MTRPNAPVSSLWAIAVLLALVCNQPADHSSFLGRSWPRLIGALASTPVADSCSNSQFLNDLVCNETPTRCADAGTAGVDPNVGQYIVNGIGPGFPFEGEMQIAGYAATPATDATDCCRQCQQDNTCDAWQYSPPLSYFYHGNYDTPCFFITSVVCAYFDSHGNAGAASVVAYMPGTTLGACDTCSFGAGSNQRKGRCTGPTGAEVIIGEADPHFKLVGKYNDTFIFDFHGLDQHSYCMITSPAIQVNVRMLSLPPTSRILQQPPQEPDSFFNGTWMSGFGIVYTNQVGEQQSITVELDQGKAVRGQQPLSTTFADGASFAPVDLTEGEPWTSPDGLTTLTRSTTGGDSLSIVVGDVLHMIVTVDTEEELIADPPVYFLNSS